MNLYIVKKYLKLKRKKEKTTKGGFQCLYAPIIVIDSSYRKVENCYSKVCLEKYYFIEERLFCYFIEDMQIFCSNPDEEY